MLDILLEYIKKIFKKISFRTWAEIIIGGVLLITSVTFIKNYKKSQEELLVSENNNMAYQTQLEFVQNELIEFQFTVEQLECFNDSISLKLKDAIKENKIKEKKIKELQYMLSDFEKKDTIKLTDTIFKDPDFTLDTNIGDKWMSTNLHMKYPNEISLSTSVRSEKSVIIHNEKVTVDPPKKFFLCRWFQKKKLVTKVTVNETNPYIKNEQNVFINTEK